MKYKIKMSCGHVQEVELYGHPEYIEDKIKFMQKRSVCGKFRVIIQSNTDRLILRDFNGNQKIVAVCDAGGGYPGADNGIGIVIRKNGQGAAEAQEYSQYD